MLKSVLIADDHELIRRTLCDLFTSQEDFDVCGEAKNGLEAIEMAQRLHPDLILLDLSMPVMNGVEAACQLKGLMPMVPIIVFRDYGDVFSEREASSSGISAVVSKTDDLTVLVNKARAVFYSAAA